jgi:S1-C subfamily serine protease
VLECRCGLQQPESEPVVAETEPETPVKRSGARGVVLLAAGLLLGLALAAIPLRSMLTPGSSLTTPQTAPEIQGAPGAAIETAPQQFAEAPSAAELTRPLNLPLTTDGAVAAPSSAAPISSPASFEDVISRTLPAVVSIDAGTARGTGFFIRPDYVLTNAHVVEGQSSVQLQAGNAKYTARVMTVSTGSDLAVLQVYNANPAQPTLRLGSATNVRVGQEVIAIGSALGVLSNTVTRGIISAVRQAGTVTLLQTDAAINPGNSGGPLVDRTGLVIGVNSMAVARRAGEGLAFAVAIDHASQLLSGQSSLAAATPLDGLNKMMGAPSAGDQMRQRGEEVYRKTIEWAARNGDQLDSYWNRYAQTCVMTASRTGDRAWFAVYEPNGIRISATSVYDCGSFLDTVRSNADTIRTEVTRAAESARQSGVYPGVMRDIRKQYRFDWVGWER